MTGIRIYMEGGGDNNNTRSVLRQGMDAFLGELKARAGERSLGWRLACCGGRQKTYKTFINDVKRPKAGEIYILLVDSEDPVTAATPFEHLRNRPGDGWDFAGVPENRVHLMVETMETWIVADPDALAKWYGPGFRENSLPRTRDLEKVRKADIAGALDRATGSTTKGRYHKILHANKLLARIDPTKVRARCRHCARLFDTLEGFLAAPA